MKKTVIAATMALMLGSTTAFAAASDQQAASKAIFDAVAANNKVAKMGFEWRDTYKHLLGPAKKAYHKGDYAEAIKLANTAKAHAELGMQQAKMSPDAHLHN